MILDLDMIGALHRRAVVVGEHNQAHYRDCAHGDWAHGDWSFICWGLSQEQRAEAKHLYEGRLFSSAVMAAHGGIERQLDQPAGPVPAYNPQEDGDYSAWLARNNID